MSQATSFKPRHREAGPAFGCWLEMFSPIAAEIVAQAGYDCVLIDLEHGPGSYLDAVALLQAVQGRACAPLVRVPSNDPVALKRVLDIGVAGVMVPAVDTTAQAEAAVAACRYPPRGRRGMAASIVRASDYGARWRDYVAAADSSLLIMCQIESAEAVRNAAAIAGLDGVDMLFVGPFDLSANTGHLGEPDHPEVRAMIEKVETAAKAGGATLGGIPTPGRSVGRLLEAGYDLVLADADVLLLRDAARSSLAALRAAAAGPR
ncbi:MAG: HpcH/HpaI aldolase/citrate lyase family protein [Kiloniellaceae bacterium]